MDWIAAFFTISGLYFAGKKKWWAWIFSIISFIPWTIFAIQHEAYGLHVINVCFLTMFIKNLIQWKRDETKLG